MPVRTGSSSAPTRRAPLLSHRLSTGPRRGAPTTTRCIDGRCCGDNPAGPRKGTMMKHTRTSRPRLLAWGAIVLSALLGVALATVPSAGALGTTPHAHHEAAAVSTPRVARSDFHDQMRKLWEDHIAWTRLSIVTFADASPGFGATADRL